MGDIHDGHRHRHFLCESSNVSSIFNPTLECESFVASEVVVTDFLAVAQEGGGGEEFFDELVEFVRAHTGLLGKGHGFCENLDDAEDHGVTDEFE